MNETRDKVLEVEIAADWMHPFDARDEDGPVVCAACADEVEIGQGFVWRPAPEYGENAIVVVHDWCALKDGYRLKWARG